MYGYVLVHNYICGTWGGGGGSRGAEKRKKKKRKKICREIYGWIVEVSFVCLYCTVRSTYKVYVQVSVAN